MDCHCRHNTVKSVSKPLLPTVRGTFCILHGGDISSQKILDKLEAIAPVTVVRGNNDKEWAEHLPQSLDFELGGLRFFMTHKKKDLPKDLSPYDLVIYGHSHKYDSTWIEHEHGKRTLLLNPGSCGPRRFHQPITMAKLIINDKGWNVSRIDLPYSGKEAVSKLGSTDIRAQIEVVVRETQKGHTVADIADKYRRIYGLTRWTIGISKCSSPLPSALNSSPGCSVWGTTSPSQRQTM